MDNTNNCICHQETTSILFVCPKCTNDKTDVKDTTKKKRSKTVKNIYKKLK